MSSVDPSRLEADIALIRAQRGPWAWHRGDEHPPADYESGTDRPPSRFPVGYVADDDSTKAGES